MQPRSFAARRIARAAVSRRAVPPTVATAPGHADVPRKIVDLATMVATLARSEAWVRWQAKEGGMPHYDAPRGRGGSEGLTFPLDLVLAWHDRRHGRNLPAPAEENRPPLRAIG